MARQEAALEESRSELANATHLCERQRLELESLRGLFLQNNKLEGLGFRPDAFPRLRKMSIAGNAMTPEERAALRNDMERAGVLETGAEGSA